MASDKNKANGHEAAEGLTVTSVPFGSVLFDLKWNARISRDVGAEAGLEDDHNGISSLMQNIGNAGQDTPIDVRDNTDAKTKKEFPYRAVTGFRRGEAIRRLYAIQPPAKIPHLAAGHIRVTLRGTMSEHEARALNGRENIARNNLKVPDQAYVIWQMGGALKEGVKGDKTMTDTDIGFALGKSQGYTSKLHRICKGFDDKTIQHWREATSPIPYGTMTDILDNCKEDFAKSAPQGIRAASLKYEETVKGKGDTTETSKAAKVKAKWEAAEKAVRKNAFLLGTLHRSGLGVKVERANWRAMLGVIEFLKLPEDGQTGPRMVKLENAAKEAFDQGKTEPEESEEEETDEDGNALTN